MMRPVGACVAQAAKPTRTTTSMRSRLLRERPPGRSGRQAAPKLAQSHPLSAGAGPPRERLTGVDFELSSEPEGLPGPPREPRSAGGALDEVLPSLRDRLPGRR